MRLSITDAVKHLLIINVIMFIGKMTIGDGLIFDGWFSLHFPQNEDFKPWQIITHMFMHGDGMHLLFNMFALWMFGTSVERQIGTKRFLFIYFSAGLGAVLFQLCYYYVDFYSSYSAIEGLSLNKEILNEILNVNARQGNYIIPDLFYKGLVPIMNENNISLSLINEDSFSALFNMNVITETSMVGASGCIMGILAAFGMMNPNAELMLIFFPVPIKAKYFIPGIIILDIISAVTGQSFFSPSNTAYMAHVGGAVIGFLIMWYWKKNSMDKYRWN